ncbi:hypothetical protein WR164_05450 [Philodulcilactobacillus myokoensis]|uniref:Uncharacterized protein n=1 Tax=Philodulcilactobacillus myokoensis TaxID=2929573 RepID=A0A9W6ERV3_9LACO|nr:hypothetical protein [Philodulcilactobacillus myokoensis]GLB46566.1 hypothetical protein WR164_05450 [Philodulcilactobacillus myokoensis]
MDNHDDLHRVKKYRFNRSRYDANRHNPQFKTWPWIIGLVFIAILIVGGIKLFNKSTVHTNRYSQSNKTAVNYERHFHKQSQGKRNQQFSQSLDRNRNNNQTSNHDSQQATAQYNNEEPSNREPPNEIFSTPHTFDSVQDALNWAKASQREWLQAGYTNFKITSDGQNDYVLRFTK